MKVKLSEQLVYAGATCISAGLMVLILGAIFKRVEKEDDKNAWTEADDAAVANADSA